MHTPEPFGRLVNQGMILGMTYKVSPDVFLSNQKTLEEKELVGIFVEEKEDEPACYIILNKNRMTGEISCLGEEQVEKRGEREFLVGLEIELSCKAEKMSKSRGNVINPDQVVDEYGADSMRLYEMFMGPLEATKPWSMRGVEGVFRFLNRVWRLLIDDRGEDMKLIEQVKDIEPDKETLRLLHTTIKRVTSDLDTMSFNTAIAAMMEFSNFLTRKDVRPRSALNTFVLLLSPFAPHLAEELWRVLGHSETIAYEPWPTYEEALTKADEITVPVQINGKLRGKVTVSAGIDQEALQAAALADPKIQALLEGKTIKKIIVVPGKLVNIVVG